MYVTSKDLYAITTCVYFYFYMYISSNIQYHVAFWSATDPKLQPQ
jgi:hypothetical protein